MLASGAARAYDQDEASVNHTALPSVARVTPQRSDIASTMRSPRPEGSRGLGDNSVGRPRPVSRTSTRISPCAWIVS